MLVLSRKRNESIRIGEDVTITVIALKGGGVRLGIDAPTEISIVRSELIPGVEASDNLPGQNSSGAGGSNVQVPSAGAV